MVVRLVDPPTMEVTWNLVRLLLEIFSPRIIGYVPEPRLRTCHATHSYKVTQGLIRIYIHIKSEWSCMQQSVLKYWGWFQNLLNATMSMLCTCRGKNSSFDNSKAKVTWNEWIRDFIPAAQAGGSEQEHCACRSHNLKPTNILSLLFVT